MAIHYASRPADAQATAEEAAGFGRRTTVVGGDVSIPGAALRVANEAADGLGGFGGGLAAERWLLALEGALPPTLDLGVH